MKTHRTIAVFALVFLLFSSCTFIQDLLNPKPPAAPTNLTATEGTKPDRITLTWTASSKATSYNIYMATTAIGTYSNIGTTASTTVDIMPPAITLGIHYFFKVSAVNSNGETMSDADEGWAGSSTSGTPTGLTASQGTSATQIDLIWTVVSGAVKYYVYQSSFATGTYAKLGETTSGTYSVTSGITAGTHYFFKVSAVGSTGTESSQSTSAEGWTALPAPTGLTVTTLSISSLSVFWSTVSGATGYKVYRENSSGVVFTTEIASPTLPPYTDSGLSSGTTYYYKVKATTSSASSVLSDIKSGTTSGPGVPQSLAASTNVAYQIELTWNAVSGATKYKVYYNTSSTGTYTAFSSNPTTNSFTAFASYGTYYYFKVSAVNASSVEGTQSDYVLGYQSGTGFQNFETVGSWKRFFTNRSADTATIFAGWSGTDTTSETLTIVAEKDSGSSTAGYGMIFNWLDWNNFWVFYVNTAGNYNVYHMSGGSIAETTYWTSSSYITTGYYQTNTLKMIASYSTGYLYFYINEHQVAYCNSVYLTAGRNHGFATYVSSSDSFPSTPVETWFQQTSPGSYPEVVGPLESFDGLRAMEGAPVYQEPLASEVSRVQMMSANDAMQR